MREAGPKAEFGGKQVQHDGEEDDDDVLLLGRSGL